MNKQTLFWGILLLASVFFCSCGKDTPGEDNTEDRSGKMTISFGFARNEPATLAASTAKPTTSWTQNIKDLLILFVRPNGTVADARNIDVPTTSGTGRSEFAFTNLVANKVGETYNVYLVANSQQNAAITAQGGWNASNCKGKNIAQMLLQLVANPGFAPVPGSPEAGSNGYLEPAEIFLAMRDGIVIAADGNTDEKAVPFELTRAVSLLRVRINQSKSGNDVINFQQANASFRVRRASNDLKVDGTYTRGNEKSVIYLTGSFNDQEPATGYAGGTILDVASDLTLWKDIKMFPGGSVGTGAQKFDVVLVGEAPAGYVPLGKTTGLLAAADVAWSGAVNEVVAANGILEINLTLESAGKWMDDPDEPGVPEPGQYGSLDISVNLVPWGNISSIDIPL